MNAQAETYQATILVIDDDAAIREVLEMLLGDEGYQVAMASNGDHGLDLASNTYFDLILIDLMMPGLGSAEFCRAYRAGGGSAPVILVTAARPADIATAVQRCGAVAYLPKPFVIDAVLETVARHIGAFSA
jgi:two-component system, NtrC family, response regulator AtoC